jgi:putative pyoverdin transport system ATP-binding/permease protein
LTPVTPNDPFATLRGFPPEGRVVVVLLIVSGLATALMIRGLVEVIVQRPPDQFHWSGILEFSVMMTIALITKWNALNRAAILVEIQLHEIRAIIGERLRQAELTDMERQDYATYLYPMLDAMLIPSAAIKAFNAFQAVVTMASALVFIFWLSAPAGLLLLLTLMFTVMVHRILSRRMARIMHETVREETRLLGHINQFLDGFQEVKAQPALSESLVRGTMLPILRRIRRLRAQVGYDEVALTNFITQGFFTLLGICVFLLSYWLHEQSLAILVATILFLWKPMWMVIDAAPLAVKAHGAWQRMLRIGDHLPPPAPQRRRQTGDPRRLRLPVDFHSLRLDAVTFDYLDRDGSVLYHFGPVSLEVRRHETLFVVGGNGSGKSTLIKLLTGLYPASGGRFLLDGRPIEIHDYRHLFTVIFNDVHLFDRPYGLPDLERRSPEIERWLGELGLAAKVRWLGDRFSRLDLAPGERKRLALIGALLEDKPILVFDEWVAEQDPQYRRLFYDRLVPELRQAGKTLIVVSHDDAYFSGADRVLTLRDGRILTNEDAS